MTSVRGTRAVRTAAALAGAALAAYELPALTFLSPALRRRLAIVDRVAGNRVALTFDDGPHRSGTPAVLAALEAEAVSATFFLVGEQVVREPGIAAEIAAAGHEIGLHCHRHRLLLGLTPAQVYDDLSRAAEAIESATGRRTVLYRPPYGVFNLAALRAVRRFGWQPTHWSRWGRDWERWATPESIVSNLCRDLEAGEVMLLHDADHYSAPGSWRATAACLPRLIETLRRRALEPGPLAPLAAAGAGAR